MRTFLIGLLVFPPGFLFAADVYEPKAGSPERAAIMEAMRAPISKHAGSRVTFTGTVQVSGEWSTFQGTVTTTDGKPPKREIGGDLDFDLFCLLRREAGKWKVLHWGFSGDIGVAIEARDKYPKAPKVLFPKTE